MLLTRQMKSNEFEKMVKHQISLFDQIDKMFSQEQFTRSISDSFPPHNIRKKDSSFLIEMAVAGYKESEIKITREKGVLSIRGEREVKDNDSIVYQGIAGRSFQKSFALGERIKVIGANLKDGMLYVGLEEEVPDEEKPQNINISQTDINISGFIS